MDEDIGLRSHRAIERGFTETPTPMVTPSLSSDSSHRAIERGFTETRQLLKSS